MTGRGLHSEETRGTKFPMPQRQERALTSRHLPVWWSLPSPRNGQSDGLKKNRSLFVARVNMGFDANVLLYLAEHRSKF